MGLAKPYRRLKDRLRTNLEVIRKLSGRSRLSWIQQVRLRLHLNHLCNGVVDYLKEYGHHKLPVFDTPEMARKNFRRKFGHEPGTLIRLASGKYRWRPFCVDYATALNALLAETLGSSDRLGTLVVQGVGECHIGVTLKGGDGKTWFLQDHRNMPKMGADTVESFKKRLRKAVHGERHPLRGMAKSLGLLHLRNPDAYLDDPRIYIESDESALEAGRYENVGLLYQLVGRFSDAKACYKKAIALLPGLADAHNLLGEAEVSDGHSQEAIAHFNEAASKVPVHVEADFNLSNLYQLLKNPEAARRHRERYQAAAPNPTVPYWLRHRKRAGRDQMKP